MNSHDILLAILTLVAGFVLAIATPIAKHIGEQLLEKRQKIASGFLHRTEGALVPIIVSIAAIFISDMLFRRQSVSPKDLATVA
jgi:Kef-type K+ transport system membrane component KefB